MTRPRLSFLGLIMAATLAVAGCSSTEGDPSSPDSSAAPTTLQEIQDAGVITVGTEGTYRPFTFHENGTGELTGYDVEVMKAVAGKLGVKAEFEETQFDGIFAGLEAGRFDVIANQVTMTDERKEKYEFSEPYTVSSGVIVTRVDNKAIDSFDDLKGKTTAQSLTSNWYELAKESGANVQAVEGWAQSVTLLKQRRVDATINDKLTYLDYQKNSPDDEIKIAAETEEKSYSALAFRKGSTEVVDAVNKALAELEQDGTLAEISNKYFGTDVSS
ncbi:amino acid ABC transporter substrate-binding protein [Arthrobacter roseus]|uniref:amino acid ABC transporter substrate-binding protein n=1 Tax=Arthrobacter roseus TaxID=136274 RepID=UPI001965A663|nr:amino acid ABC transporter substrate-binding protein [Arthrobacter roseus]MBM7846893.1 cystine transport system substrate-binding protein [Arthrobacter roseus]